MTKQTRRRFTPEYKEHAVARLSEDGMTYASLAAGVSPPKDRPAVEETVEITLTNGRRLSVALAIAGTDRLRKVWSAPAAEPRYLSK